jgi:SMI1 / KNR4 family (SUKH-1)
VNIRARRFYNPFCLVGAGELLEGQNGYSLNPIENEPIADWPPHYVVIASHGGDPFVLDLSHSDGNDAPVLTAERGTGKWSFERVAESFAAFLAQLAK